MDEQKKQLDHLQSMIQQLLTNQPPPPTGQPINQSNNNAQQLTPPGAGATPQPTTTNATTGGSSSRKSPDAKSISMLEKDINWYNFQDWRIIWDSFCDKEDLESFSVVQQRGCLLTRFSPRLISLMKLHCKVDLKDKAVGPKEILDSLAEYLKSQEHTVRNRIAFNKRQ